MKQLTKQDYQNLLSAFKPIYGEDLVNTEFSDTLFEYELADIYGDSNDVFERFNAYWQDKANAFGADFLETDEGDIWYYDDVEDDNPITAADMYQAVLNDYQTAFPTKSAI